MSQDPNIIEKVERVGGTSSQRINALSGDPSQTEESSQHFSQLVNNPSTQQIQAQHVVRHDEVKKIEAPSPMDVAQQVDRDQRNLSPKQSLDDLTADNDANLKKIVDMKETLVKNPNLQFTPLQEASGTRSLVHMDESLRIALSKVGSDTPVAKVPIQTDMSTPAHKFIGYLTSSQYQLEHLNEQISFLSSSGTTLSLTNMMALQMKMGIVTNQVEFFAGLLSKSLEATKTIMNIQV